MTEKMKPTAPAKILSERNVDGSKRGGGRPTLCTPEGYEPLLGLLRMGMYVQQACHMVGISRDTIYDWLKRGSNGEEPYAEFSAAYEKAAAQAEMVALSDIRAGKNNWQSRAWFLERRFRDRWGRNDKLEIKPVAPERVTAAEARRVMTEIFSGDVTPDDDVKPVVGAADDTTKQEP